VLEVVPIVSAKGRRHGMYTVGLQPSDTIDPLELLQAAEPAGLVCYFTALAFHGLTTQSPTHHHIARLVDRPRQPPSTAPRVPVGDTGPKRSRDPLGKLRFTFKSVPYYETSRALHTVAGIQLRHLNDRSMVRITTREQALLDTLHRPVSCGGLSVAWEAWETGLSGLDEARLHEHLVALAEPRHLRRVGYLLEAFRYTPVTSLRSLLEDARTNLAADPAAQVVPLFPGLPAVTMNTAWRLDVPTP
jgi:predicted transcriptional regulator of viral defense system